MGRDGSLKSATIESVGICALALLIASTAVTLSKATRENKDVSFMIESFLWLLFLTVTKLIRLIACGNWFFQNHHRLCVFCTKVSNYFTLVSRKSAIFALR